MFMSCILEMIPKRGCSLDERWDMFENAATYRCAHSILNRDKKVKMWNSNSNFHRKMASKYFAQPYSVVIDFLCLLNSSDSYPSEDQNEGLKSTVDEQQTVAGVKEELSILKSAVMDIQQDLNKVRLIPRSMPTTCK